MSARIQQQAVSQFSSIHTRTSCFRLRQQPKQDFCYCLERLKTRQLKNVVAIRGRLLRKLLLVLFACWWWWWWWWRRSYQSFDVMETLPQLVGSSQGVSFVILQSPLVSSTTSSASSSPLTSILLPITLPKAVLTNPQPILPKPLQSKGFEAVKASEKKSGRTRIPPLKPPKKQRTEDNEILRCKRKLDFISRLGIQRPCPVAVERRNERERKRVKQINSTFLHLRDHLPEGYWESKKVEKVSKVDTLRAAIDYISGLQSLIEEYDASSAVANYSSALLYPQELPSPDPPLVTPSESLLQSLTVNTTNASGQLRSQSGDSRSPGSLSSGSEPSHASPSISPTVDSQLLDIASWLVN